MYDSNNLNPEALSVFFLIMMVFVISRVTKVFWRFWTSPGKTGPNCKEERIGGIGSAVGLILSWGVLIGGIVVAWLIFNGNK